KTRSATRAQNLPLGDVGATSVSVPDDSQVEQDERPKKRARTRKREVAEVSKGADARSSPGFVGKPARKKRKLDMMMTMPVDVFCEIAHYLGPDDILRLSRSSKALRELLVSKSSRVIWHTAEESVGLPACPPDLSSPQYAALLFDTFCTHCLKARAFNHIITLRVRLCQKCFKKNIVSGDQIFRVGRLPEKYSTKPVAYMLVPTKDFSRVFQRIPQPPKVSDFSNCFYYLPQFRAILKEYSSFKESSATQKEFEKERLKMVWQMWPKVKAVESWLKKEKELRAKDRSNATMSRKDSVFKKLKELGYRDDYLNSSLDEKDWIWDSLIEQTRPLTERIWNNIRPQLEETLRLRQEKLNRIWKEERLKEHRENLIKLVKDFFYSEDGKTCCVAVSAFLKLPLSQEMIRADESWAIVVQTHWNSLKQKMLDLSESRKRSVTEEATYMVVKARAELGLPDISASDSSNDVDFGSQLNAILQHPSSVFGDYRLFYSGKCLFTFSTALDQLRTSCLRSYENRYNLDSPLSWEIGALDRSVIRIAEALYTSVGVARTLDDMYALDKSFVCMRCAPSTRLRYTWINLIGHFYSKLISFEFAKEDRLENLPGKLAGYFEDAQQYEDLKIAIVNRANCSRQNFLTDRTSL
ncbi:hypothetical protein EW145_g7059, partial [Phellinidium pouzarii]